MAIRYKVDKSSFNTRKEHPDKYWVDFKEDGDDWTGAWLNKEEIEELKQRRKDELDYEG